MKTTGILRKIISTILIITTISCISYAQDSKKQVSPMREYYVVVKDTENPEAIALYIELANRSYCKLKGVAIASEPQSISGALKTKIDDKMPPKAIILNGKELDYKKINAIYTHLETKIIAIEYK